MGHTLDPIKSTQIKIYMNSSMHENTYTREYIKNIFICIHMKTYTYLRTIFSNLKYVPVKSNLCLSKKCRVPLKARMLRLAFIRGKQS